jgi:hypothetical protein
MNFKTTELYTDLKHREKVLEEQLRHFNHGREKTELELAAVKATLNALEHNEWTHW